ncbi:hotdog fold thioesterase [Muricauda oceani]|uniref:Hotdog fold thioesterase n=1 Tax=Flagellimonas oceani TaxID=2698672 RepID=A0A6G7IZT3_9FLAO|nr:hotdog fold thioesterase [Allomuricauda oceani]MBW8244777.1 hotdog fold thioesterase [Allomuricauda oceani]QII43910.1 hotdog fold thioesterase [Allomuricauda oceani]
MVDKNLEPIRIVFEEKIPMHKFLGLKVKVLKKNYAKINIPFRQELIGDFRNNRWHGGIIAAILDAVGGLVGATLITSSEDKLATIDLRVDYLKGAKAQDITVEGTTVKLGNRILVTQMKAFQNGQFIAEGKGVYSLIRNN